MITVFMSDQTPYNLGGSDFNLPWPCGSTIFDIVYIVPTNDDYWVYILSNGLTKLIKPWLRATEK